MTLTKIVTNTKTSMNTLRILLLSHTSTAEKIPPKAKKTIPIISIMLTENRIPTCVMKAPITRNPIVKIKWRDLKSLIADL